MGFLFTLKYKLGMFPNYEKISTEWNQILEKKRTLDSLKDSDLIKEYIQLKKQFGGTVVSTQNSETANLEQELKKLAKNKKVKKFLALGTENIDDQPFEVIHYMELKATLENVQKQAAEQTSDTADVDKNKYQQLLVSPEVKKYETLVTDPTLDYFNSNNILLEESFEKNNDFNGSWALDPQYSEFSGGSYSQQDDFHCYCTDNVKVLNGICDIALVKQQSQSKIWSPVMGFVPKTFDFTSGILRSKNAVQASKISIEVAAQFKPTNGIVHALVLKDKKSGQMIDLFRSGKKGVGFGIPNGNGGKYTSLTCLDFGKKHVYRVDITSSQVVWYMNNQEVARQNISASNAEWDMTALVAAKSQNVPASNLKLDWVRVVDRLV